jgi:hypothetical protein
MTTPIDMVLFCPECGTQHIDAPSRDSHAWCDCCKAPPAAPCYDWCTAWTNPPHRSHLCALCGHVWRPADVPTNGVPAITTRGKEDHPIRPGRVNAVRLLLAQYRSAAEDRRAFRNLYRTEKNRLDALQTYVDGSEKSTKTFATIREAADAILKGEHL